MSYVERRAAEIVASIVQDERKRALRETTEIIEKHARSIRRTAGAANAKKNPAAWLRRRLNEILADLQRRS